MSSNSDVNAVQIEHLSKQIEDLGKKVEEQGAKREEKYTEIADNVTQQLTTNSLDIKQLSIAVANVTKEHSNTVIKVSKNEKAILELERNYVSKNYFHKWLLGACAIVLGLQMWQDQQTQKYFTDLKASISLNASQQEELERYQEQFNHLLKNDFVEFWEHFNNAKKGM
jgi:hypothetical protein